MEKTPLEILNKREITLPPKSTARALRILLKLMQSNSDVTYKYLFDTNEIKNKQVILLADHATRDAYKYVLSGYPFATPNIVIGYQNIFVKGLFKLLLNAGIIPKKLYQADPKSILNMLKVLKLGGSLCIFPEGIQSATGSTHPIFAGTANLLKKAGVTVILCKSYGSYLVRPRYKKTESKGHQEFHYEILFTEQELAELSIDEIDRKLLDRFRYNDFEWNKIHRYKYKGTKNQPLAKGIENILYHCPKCNSEFKIKTEGNDIICEKCGNTVTLNEYYDLIPKSKNDFMPYSSIDEWFKYQRSLAKEEAKKGFCYTYECDIYDLHTEKLSTHPYYKCGEGVVTLTNNYIHYKGTKNDKNVDMYFVMKEIPCFIFTPGQDNYFYYYNAYYNFRPKQNNKKVVKYMLISEEAHRLLDKTWDKISYDAYGI